MRDLSTHELGHVYGAGGKSRHSCKPKPSKCGKGTGTRGHGSRGRGKGSRSRGKGSRSGSRGC